MAVRTKRLASATVGAGTTVIYTCPAGETTIVKSVSIHNTQAILTVTTVVNVRIAGVDYGFQRAISQNGAVTTTSHFVVLQPGEQVTVTSDGAGQRILLSGAQLEGVAD